MIIKQDLVLFSRCNCTLKLSFYVKEFKSYSLNRHKHRHITYTDRQTHGQTDGQTDMTKNIGYPHDAVVNKQKYTRCHFSLVVVCTTVRYHWPLYNFWMRTVRWKLTILPSGNSNWPKRPPVGGLTSFAVTVRVTVASGQSFMIAGFDTPAMVTLF